MGNPSKKWIEAVVEDLKILQIRRPGTRLQQDDKGYFRLEHVEITPITEFLNQGKFRKTIRELVSGNTAKKEEL